MTATRSSDPAFLQALGDTSLRERPRARPRHSASTTMADEGELMRIGRRIRGRPSACIYDYRWRTYGVGTGHYEPGRWPVAASFMVDGDRLIFVPGYRGIVGRANPAVRAAQ